MLLLLRFTLASISLIGLITCSLLAFHRPDHAPGETFLYGEVDPVSHTEELYLLEPDTGSAQLLFTQPGWFDILAISQDGQSLYVVDTSIYCCSGIFRFYLASFQGRVQHKLADAYMVGIHDFSPDGRWLAFVEYEYSHTLQVSVMNLYVVSENGHDKQQLMGDQFTGMQNIAWSPDGHSLAFTGFDSNSAPGLWLLDLQGATLEKISGQSDIYLMEKTSTGLVFTSRTNSGDDVRAYYLYDWNSRTMTQLFELQGRYQGISSDERWLYITDTPDPSHNYTRLIQVSLSGDHEIQALYKGQRLGVIQVQDDWLILQDNSNLYRIGLEGAPVEQLTSSAHFAEAPVYISPHTGFLYYLEADSQSTILYRMKADGSQRQRISVHDNLFEFLLPYPMSYHQFSFVTWFITALAGLVLSMVRRNPLRALL
jgi:dipeptidyl aminopeptidase/acylaminoacyl peptidase